MRRRAPSHGSRIDHGFAAMTGPVRAARLSMVEHDAKKSARVFGRHHAPSDLAVACFREGGLSDLQHDTMVARRDRIAAWVNEHCRSPKKGAPTSFPGTERRDPSLALAARFGFDGTERLSRRWMRSEASSATNPGSPQPVGATATREPRGGRRFFGLPLSAGRSLRDTGTEGRNLGAEGRGPRRASRRGRGDKRGLDAKSGDLLGHFTQGLSHLALVHAAVSLEARREGTADDVPFTFPSCLAARPSRSALRPLPTGRRSSFPCLDRLTDPDHRLDRKHRPGSPAR